MTCNCHPLSPFLWRKNKKPSIFVDLVKASRQSIAQSTVVERKREQGQDISHIGGLSEVSHARRITDFKQFTVYSRARPSK